MPPRSRPTRRSTIKEEDQTLPSTSTPRRNSRRGKAEETQSPEVELEEDIPPAEEEQPEAGPSRRTRAPKGRAAPRSSGRRGLKAELDVEEDVPSTDPLTENDEENDEETQVEREEVNVTPRKRVRKSVSYLEVPVSAVDEVEEDQEEDEDLPDEGEGVIDVEVGDEDAEGEVEDVEDGSPDPLRKSGRAGRPIFEKVGSGRGGFSVKGAAAAAARARWAKARREKAERGEESDEDRPRRRPAASATLRNKKPDDIPVTGATVLVKGQEYIMGEDELIMEDNEKGDTKVDAMGNLLGGREYKFYTYNSEVRRDSNRLYALTIDVARSCGYTDSLAFLRRVPQIIKLSCYPSERDLLIEKGRVTGNLKHRMVTMIAVRNLYKLLGARVIKDGKWVEDDYDEQAATVKCQEGGFTPGTIVQDEEVVQHTTSVVRQEYRGEGGRAANLVPFYSIGGSTTQFGGNGADPLSEAGWGNKRAKFKTLGVTEEDWMLRTAEETRRIDAQLREYREERLVPLEGGDLKGWVYTTENLSEGKEDQGVEEVSMAVPDINVVKEDQDDAAPSSPSAIKEDEEALTPLPLSSLQGNDVEMAEVEKDGADEVAVEDGVERTIGGRIVVETEENARRRASKYNWGLGSWQAGEVRASYEPHTHIPHIPLYTQPQSALRDRLSHYPLLASYADSKHQNFVQSTVIGPAARGLASVEYALETRSTNPSRPEDGPWDMSEGQLTPEDRLRAVREAEEWEREARIRKKMTADAMAILATM